MTDLDDFREFVTVRARTIAGAHGLGARVDVCTDYDRLWGETAYFRIEFLRGDRAVAWVALDGDAFVGCAGAVPALGDLVDLECATTLHEALDARAVA